MKRIVTFLLGLMTMMTTFAMVSPLTSAVQQEGRDAACPLVVEQPREGYYALATPDGAATICIDAEDYAVVSVVASL